MTRPTVRLAALAASLGASVGTPAVVRGGENTLKVDVGGLKLGMTLAQVRSVVHERTRYEKRDG